jgi:hypothetical protein
MSEHTSIKERDDILSASAMVRDLLEGHEATIRSCRAAVKAAQDAWNARTRIGDIPVTVISDEPSAATIRQSPFASERPARLAPGGAAGRS